MHNVTGIQPGTFLGYSDGMAATTNPSPDPTAKQTAATPRRWIPLSLRIFVAILVALGCGSLV